MFCIINSIWDFPTLTLACQQLVILEFYQSGVERLLCLPPCFNIFSSFLYKGLDSSLTAKNLRD